jgi:hypothetical protein
VFDGKTLASPVELAHWIFNADDGWPDRRAFVTMCD